MFNYRGDNGVDVRGDDIVSIRAGLFDSSHELSAQDIETAKTLVNDIIGLSNCADDLNRVEAFNFSREQLSGWTRAAFERKATADEYDNNNDGCSPCCYAMFYCIASNKDKTLANFIANVRISSVEVQKNILSQFIPAQIHALHCLSQVLNEEGHHISQQAVSQAMAISKERFLASGSTPAPSATMIR